MSDGTCPTCGEPLVRKLSGRGAVLSEHSCREAAWAREVERRGLVRVIGRSAVYLYDRGLVQYGPFRLTAEQAARDAGILRAEGADPWAVERTTHSALPRHVKSAFAPRWAYEVARAFGIVEMADPSGSVFEFVRGDEGLQRTVEAAAMLAENASDARKAVAAVVRSAMQEVKDGKAGGDRG